VQLAVFEAVHDLVHQFPAASKLDDTKRREIAEAVISGRKTAAQMARMFGVSPPTVSRIVAAHVAAGAH
jgi:DNA-binding Lrp family transcriptional regulator